MNGDLELFAQDTDPLSFSKHEGFSSFIPLTDGSQVVEDFGIEPTVFIERARILASLQALGISGKDIQGMTTDELIQYLQTQRGIGEANVSYSLVNFQS